MRRLERVISRVVNEDGVIGPWWRPRGLDIAQVYQKAEPVQFGMSLEGYSDGQLRTTLKAVSGGDGNVYFG
jgi:hypothetical protein